MTHLKKFLKAEILNCVAYEASKGAIAGTGAGLLVTAASNGLIDSTGNAILSIIPDKN